MSKLKLTMGISDYDHTRDIATGRVPVEGCEINALDFEVEEIFYRFTLHREWDVSEMSMAKFVAQVSGDRPDILGIPVFPSRVFRLSNLYVHSGSGIKSPDDLKGKRVGTPEWAQTASVYTRGWLVDDAGIKLQDIDWRQAGVDQPGRVEKVKIKYPKGVKVTAMPDKCLSDMLVTGELDAAMSAHAPQSFLDGNPKVKRLFPNYQKAEQEYYERTKVFPIMHVIAIRKEILDAHPWVAGNLVTAFEQAKQRSLARCLEITASRFPVPWVTDTTEKRMKLLGEDFFPYGIEPNRVTLEAFLKWCHEQGVTRRRLKPEELFPASVAGSFKI